VAMSPLTSAGAGRSLFVHRSGIAGPAVVMLHGLDASGRSWRLVADRLRDTTRLFCPDQLGFGRSPWPTVAYTVTDHLDALTATLDGLDVAGPVVLAGHSTGAMLALEWAAAHPERLAAVVLVSLPAYRSPEGARRHISSLSPLAWATVDKPHRGETICGLMCAWWPFWRKLVPLLTPGVPADISRDYVLHDWTSYSSTPRNVLIDHRAAPSAQALAGSSLPVRLLHGDRDTIAPLNAVQELADRHHWPLQVVAGGEHHLPAKRPAVCAAVLPALVAPGRPVKFRSGAGTWPVEDERDEVAVGRK